MKNALLKLLCKILPIPKHLAKNRFLIVSTTALGDTLWATPTIESLRKSFPNAYIGVLTSSIGYEVLKTNPYIDKIFLLTHLFSLWLKLYKERFDTVLILHTSQRIVLPLCSLIGASRILGTTGINKGLDSLLTHPLKPMYEHEILRRLCLLQAIGGQIHTERLSFFPENNSASLHTSTAFQQNLYTGLRQSPGIEIVGDGGSIASIQPPSSTTLSQELSRNSSVKILLKRCTSNWIAIHPGSKDSFKRWPARHFITVGKTLQKEGFRVFITGNKEEKSLLEEVSQQINDSEILATSTLHHFAHILSQVNLLISNDTGPVHLASALNIPTIAIYGPTDPILCGPHIAQNTITLLSTPTCTPCLKRKCGSPFCLLQISPQQVISAFYNSLNINHL